MVKTLRIGFALCGFAMGLLPHMAEAGNGTRLPPSHFVGIRPAAMGQAFTAVADDQNALYYNPAGLAKRDSWSLEILSPYAGVNQYLIENMDAFEDLAKLGQSGSGGNTDKFVEDLKPILTALSGENHFLRVGINPYFVMRNFGIGVYVNEEAEVVPHGNALPNILDFQNQTDVDVRLGGGYRFFGDKLAVGGAASWHARGVVLLDNLGVFDLVDISKDKAKRDDFLKQSVRLGYGIGLDAGMLFTPVETWTPTIGLSIMNIGDTKFRKIKSSSSKFDAGTPDALPQTVNMGASVTPTFGSWFLRGALDFRDVNLPTPASQKPALGGEAGFKGKWISGAVQAGLSEGYASGGLELRMIVVNLRYATYKTERGYFPTQNPERRHLLGVKIIL